MKLVQDCIQTCALMLIMLDFQDVTRGLVIHINTSL
jgi:hypothetical protein